MCFATFASFAAKILESNCDIWDNFNDCFRYWEIGRYGDREISFEISPKLQIASSPRSESNGNKSKRRKNMKLKINWKELGKRLWNAVRPVLLGAVGGGLVAVAGSGCSALTPSTKTQTMSLYAIGIPGIAVVSQSEQTADNKGDDENKPTQANPVSVTTKIK